MSSRIPSSNISVSILLLWNHPCVMKIFWCTNLLDSYCLSHIWYEMSTYVLTHYLKRQLFYSLSLFGIKYSMDKFLYRLVKLKVCSDVRYLFFWYQELTLKLVSWVWIWHCYKQSKNNGFIFNFVLIYCTLLHCSTAYLFQASKTFRQRKAEIIREQKTYLN